MAGVEQGNFNNEEFIEKVVRNDCVYHRNSKYFKVKNKQANYWEKIGEKFTFPQHKNCVWSLSEAIVNGCDFLASNNARAILTLPLSEMYVTVGSAIACDRLRLYGNNSLSGRLRSYGN